MDAHQVNDSLYELYEPAGIPTMQILFFHGLPSGELTEPYLLTWESGDGSCIWPKTWLADAFPDARILVVAYNKFLRESFAERHEVRSICEKLISDLIQANIGQTVNCPVVLVGHSFGGLVIKDLCLEAHKRLIFHIDKAKVQKFLNNLRGVFYYSTPHHGSPHIRRAASVLSSALFKYFTILSTHADRLNYEFNRLHKSYPNWKIEGLGERLSVKTGLFQGIVVVPEASATDGQTFNVETHADHFSISRPENKTSRRFYILAMLLKIIICDDLKDEIAMAQKQASRRKLEYLQLLDHEVGAKRKRYMARMKSAKTDAIPSAESDDDFEAETDDGSESRVGAIFVQHLKGGKAWMEDLMEAALMEEARVEEAEKARMEARMEALMEEALKGEARVAQALVEEVWMGAQKAREEEARMEEAKEEAYQAWIESPKVGWEACKGFYKARMEAWIRAWKARMEAEMEEKARMEARMARMENWKARMVRMEAWKVRMARMEEAAQMARMEARMEEVRKAQMGWMEARMEARMEAVQKAKMAWMEAPMDQAVWKAQLQAAPMAQKSIWKAFLEPQSERVREVHKAELEEAQEVRKDQLEAARMAARMARMEARMEARKARMEARDAWIEETRNACLVQARTDQREAAQMAQMEARKARKVVAGKARMKASKARMETLKARMAARDVWWVEFWKALKAPMEQLYQIEAQMEKLNPQVIKLARLSKEDSLRNLVWVAGSDAMSVLTVNDNDNESRGTSETPQSRPTDEKRPEMIVWRLELVDDFITEVNICCESGYFLSKEWLFGLDKHGNEEVMSVLRRNGYLEIYETDTTVLYEKLEENVQVLTLDDDPSPTSEDNDHRFEDTEPAEVLDENAAPGKIEHVRFNTPKRDGDIVDSDLQSNEASQRDSRRSQLDRGGTSLTTSDEMLISLRKAVENRSQYNYSISTKWLSTLNDHQRDDLKSALVEAGYSQIYETQTTAHFERIQDYVRNCPTNQRETVNTSCNGNIVNGAESTSECPGRGDSLDLQGSRIDDNASYSVTSEIKASQKADAKCLCHPQMLTVSFRSDSPSLARPSTSSSSGAHSLQRSTRQPAGDCFVTIPKKRRGREIATSLDKDISMTTIEYSTETGASNEVVVGINLSVATQLRCCLRGDHDDDDKKIRIEFLEIKGDVKLEESFHNRTNCLVLQSVRTNVDACLNRKEADDFDEIRLQIRDDECHSQWRRVLESYQPLDRDGRRSNIPESLLWLGLSGKHPINSEHKSKTLELQCDVYHRLEDDLTRCKTRALGLHFVEGTPVTFEGDVDADFGHNSFLEINVRYAAEVSYNVLRYPVPRADQPYVPTRRENKVVDFDCILVLKTKNLK